VRVEFVWHVDRFGHVVSLVKRDGMAVPLLESVEGDGDGTWPASPPLQHLHFEDLAGGGRAALLVGMAGRNHWSASIEADPAKAAITFDLACRVSDAPHRLGSRYTVAGGADRIPLAADAPFVDVRLAETACVLTPDGQPACAARLEVNDGQLLHVAPRSTAATGTIRWKYRLALE
jgi:hypothetical protein